MVSAFGKEEWEKCDDSPFHSGGSNTKGTIADARTSWDLAAQDRPRLKPSGRSKADPSVVNQLGRWVCARTSRARQHVALCPNWRLIERVMCVCCDVQTHCAPELALMNVRH